MLVEWVDQQRHTIRTHRKMNANFQNFRKLFLFYFYLDSFNHLETKSRFQISTIVNFVHWNIWTIWIITFHDTNTISSTKQILSRHNFQQQYQNNMSILKKTPISKNDKSIKGQMNSSLRRHKWEWWKFNSDLQNAAFVCNKLTE